MLKKLALFTFLVVCCSINVKSQCIPDTINNFGLLTDEYKLFWDTVDNCPSISYILTIHSDGILSYSYLINDTDINVSFLPVCREYTFTVSATSEHIVGRETQFNTRLRFPADTNIQVYNITAAQIDNDLLLQWTVLPKFHYCVDRYKVKIWDEISDDPLEITTEVNTYHGYYIVGAPYCMSYKVEVSVEFLQYDYPSAQFNYTVPAATNMPSLRYIRQDSVTINTTWALEKFSVNRCRISALHVNGTRFNATVPIKDNLLRSPVDVSITGLHANTMYYFNVTIENEGGISNPFQIAVQTVPIEPGSDLYNIYI